MIRSKFVLHSFLFRAPGHHSRCIFSHSSRPCLPSLHALLMSATGHIPLHARAAARLWLQSGSAPSKVGTRPLLAGDSAIAGAGATSVSILCYPSPKDSVRYRSVLQVVVEKAFLMITRRASPTVASFLRPPAPVGLTTVELCGTVACTIAHRSPLSRIHESVFWTSGRIVWNIKSLSLLTLVPQTTDTPRAPASSSRALGRW